MRQQLRDLAADHPRFLTNGCLIHKVRWAAFGLYVDGNSRLTKFLRLTRTSHGDIALFAFVRGLRFADA